jgi:hypothetical protein
MLASAAACCTWRTAYKAYPQLDGLLHSRIDGGAWSSRDTWIGGELIVGRRVG